MSLKQVTERALVRMLARNLSGSPSASEINLVAAVYVDDFMQRGLSDDDADRVTAAFEALGPMIDHFPTPADVLGMLPAREPQKMLEHEITDEERARNLERLDAMMRKAGLR